MRTARHLLRFTGIESILSQKDYDLDKKAQELKSGSLFGDKS
jgi:hypothetical protein